VSVELPPPLVAFIRDHVSSIELLEVLLLLRREASRTWNAAAVAAELRISPTSASSRLRALEQSRLAKQDSEGFVYEASDPDRAALVALLAERYQTHRIKVIETVFRNPDKNVRVFADAFLLKPPKGGTDE
jgi:hypothetical protein